MTGLSELGPEALAELQTPCLVVDLAAVDRNIRHTEDIASASGLRLRPHFKAHKCTELMLRQLRSGIAVGVTCQTVREAVALIEAGVRDVLVANEIVTHQDLELLVAATHRAHIGVAIDAAEHVALLRGVASRFADTVSVFIEVDVGSHRCGVEAEGDELLELAAAVARTRGLRLEGILGYEGHAVLKVERAERESLVQEVARTNARAMERLRGAGFHVGTATGGGTGTLAIVARLGSHTEVQPGSYVLMDATYARLGLPFEPALFCLTSVISRGASDRAVADAGLKSLSVEYGMPVPLQPGLTVSRLADEHALLAVAPDAAGPRIGDRLLLQPSHVDPTVNLHSRLHVWDGEYWQGWATDGRYL